MKLIALILVVLIGFNSTGYAYDIPWGSWGYLHPEPYMTLTVWGHADRDGRVITEIERRYINPMGLDIEFTDGMHLDTTLPYRGPGEHAVIVDASEGLEANVSRVSGRPWLEISGKTNEKETYVKVRLDTISSQPGWDSYKAYFCFYDNLLSSLPLKQFNIQYNLPQTAVKTDETIITLLGGPVGEDRFRHELNASRVIKGNYLTWLSVDFQNLSIPFEQLELLTLELGYTIPDLVRHNMYMYLLGSILLFLAFIIYYLFTLKKKNEIDRMKIQDLD